MKKEFFMTLVAVGMVAGLSANTPVAPAQNAQHQEKSVANLSSDELAFAAKLNDENRKVFTKFSAEQRKAAMTASCVSGACAVSQKATLSPNDAVAKVSKDASAVVVEKQEATTSSKPAVQVK